MGLQRRLAHLARAGPGDRDLALDVPSILAAFDLGSWGRLSDGPVASGRLGAIWRLDAETGSWAVKQVGESPLRSWPS